MEVYIPVLWAMLLGVAVALYVIHDGFDLGIGILFPFAREEKEQDQMINSIAPFWDGNETWLVSGAEVALYVILDGFDLGIGILFPFAREEKEQDQMINSIAPFWDGNETWLD